jgi:hypothetical protein
VSGPLGSKNHNGTAIMLAGMGDTPSLATKVAVGSLDQTQELR